MTTIKERFSISKEKIGPTTLPSHWRARQSRLSLIPCAALAAGKNWIALFEFQNTIFVQYKYTLECWFISACKVSNVRKYKSIIITAHFNWVELTSTRRLEPELDANSVLLQFRPAPRKYHHNVNLRWPNFAWCIYYTCTTRMHFSRHQKNY